MMRLAGYTNLIRTESRAAISGDLERIIAKRRKNKPELAEYQMSMPQITASVGTWLWRQQPQRKRSVDHCRKVQRSRLNASKVAE